MKKIIFALSTILIVTFCAYTIKCQDVLIKINQLKTYGQDIIVNKIIYDDESKANEEKNQTEKIINMELNNVRIVLMNSDFSSIYHNNIEIKKKEKININYGKDFQNSEIVNEDKIISCGSEYFNESSIIKISNNKKKIHINSIKRNGKINGYKGDIYLYKTENGIVVVNEVGIEDYVAAVVSSELNNSYPNEALKAQAVCARTYIAKRINNEKYKEYNAFGDDSTAYQVYNIVEPDEKIRDAVAQTKGEVVTYNDNLINTYFFSTSCGYTTDYKIWGSKKQKYLSSVHIKQNSNELDETIEFDSFIKKKSKEDLENGYPFYRWNVKMSKSHLRYVVNNYIGYDIGKITKIEINNRGSGGIVSNITVYGKNKQISISNQINIRKALNPYGLGIKLNDGDIRSNMSMLPSSFFSIENIYRNGKWWGIKIYGGGFGHGCGMSQNGCRELANLGYSYEDIIKFFYKKTAIAVSR